MIQMIVSDIDGTLLHRDHTISPKTRKVIHDCVNQGCTFVLASGRSYTGILDVWELLGFEGYSVCFNGACIYYKGECLHHQGYAFSDVLDLLNMMEDEKISAYITCDQGEFVHRSLYEPAVQKKATWVQHTQCLDSYAYRAQLPLHAMVYKISLYLNDPNKAKRILSLCHQYQFTLLHADEGFYDVYHPQCEKACGVYYLAKRLHIERDQILCIGDDENDISMLKYAGTSIVMGNASQNVKQHGDIVTLSCDEDGVADVLSKLVLRNY